MPKPKRKPAKKAGKGGGKAKKAGKGGGKKKGKKKGKKRKKKKKKVKEEPEVVLAPLLDPYAIRTQCLRQRSCLDIGHGNSREGRLADVVLDSLLPPLRFWSHLREIRMWGHGAHDAKRLAVALYEAKSKSKIDTLCLRSNDLGRWDQPKGPQVVDGVEVEGVNPEEVPEAEQVTLPDEMTDPLAVILMLPGLTNLDLSQNQWSPSEEFAAVMASKPQLRVLQLNNNKLGSSGLSRLLNAIPNDSKLEEFGISKNEIGPAGGKKLAHALANRFEHLQIVNASGNLFGPARFELGESLIYRPSVSVIMESGTLNRENYTKILRSRAAAQQRVRDATCFICRFFRRCTKELKAIRLAKEAEQLAAAEAAAAAEAERLKAEKAAAKAAKKAGKKGKKGKKGKRGKKEKKGKKGKKEKKGAGPSKKKGGKKKEKKSSKKKKKKKK
eukprot:g15.t1